MAADLMAVAAVVMVVVVVVMAVVMVGGRCASGANIGTSGLVGFPAPGATRCTTGAIGANSAEMRK